MINGRAIPTEFYSIYNKWVWVKQSGIEKQAYRTEKFNFSSNLSATLSVIGALNWSPDLLQMQVWALWEIDAAWSLSISTSPFSCVPVSVQNMSWKDLFGDVSSSWTRPAGWSPLCESPSSSEEASASWISPACWLRPARTRTRLVSWP